MSVVWEEPSSRRQTWTGVSEPTRRRYLLHTGGNRKDIFFKQRGHPLGSVDGQVNEARAILWEDLGFPDFSQCAWCGWALSWLPSQWPIKAQVDHLNGDSTDNRPENLTTACHWCNSQRYNLGQRFQGALLETLHLDPRLRTAFLKLQASIHRWEALLAKVEAMP